MNNNRFRNPTTLVLIGLLLGCGYAASGSANQCQKLDTRFSTGTLKRFQAEVKSYWQAEMAFIGEKDRVARYKQGAQKILKHGLKLRLPGTFLLFDVPRSFIRARDELSKQKEVYGERDFKRLMLIPADLAQRNGTHFLLQFAVVMVGKAIVESLNNPALLFQNIIAQAAPPLT